MNKEQLIVFIEEIIANLPKEHIRRGQVVFNAFYDACPELAEGIRSSEVDPFYVDAKLEAFGAWLHTKLEEEADEDADRYEQEENQDD